MLLWMFSVYRRWDYIIWKILLMVLWRSKGLILVSTFVFGLGFFFSTHYLWLYVNFTFATKQQIPIVLLLWTWLGFITFGSIIWESYLVQQGLALWILYSCGLALWILFHESILFLFSPLTVSFVHQVTILLAVAPQFHSWRLQPPCYRILCLHLNKQTLIYGENST